MPGRGSKGSRGTKEGRGGKGSYGERRNRDGRSGKGNYGERRSRDGRNGKEYDGAEKKSQKKPFKGGALGSVKARDVRRDGSYDRRDTGRNNRYGALRIKTK